MLMTVAQKGGNVRCFQPPVRLKKPPRMKKKALDGAKGYMRMGLKREAQGEDVGEGLNGGC